ncbi:MAG: glycosyltransferase family 39 protein [Oscillospiraceae bacterium]|nr:glycosyltransferase family 39 protein [Oscillospiraceae bacterium]
MKKALERYGALLLVLILVTGVCLLFSVRKSGMFIDEIYTYGLSNSHYAPYLTNVQGGDSFVDAVLTRQDLLDYLVVNDGEGFDFGSVVYNQAADVHPPLYYWLFNAASSLTPNVFSKWTGLVLDYLIYAVCLVLLYRLVRALGGSRLNAAAAAGLYGLSVMGLSTMLMIRMYVLMTAFTVLLALLVARLMRQPRFLWYPLIGLTIFLGLMTQYYFVFYAFFLCAAYVFYALFRREYKSLGLFALFAFLGVGCLLLAFPACLDQLFADKLVSGGNAMDNLRDFAQYPTRLRYYFADMRHGVKAAIIVGLVCLPAVLLCWGRLRAAARAGKYRIAGWLVILLPTIPTFVLAAILSPVLDQRYVYNLAPILVTAVSFLLYLLEESMDDFPRARVGKTAALLAILAFALHIAHYSPPQYLYPEYPEYDALVAAHAEDPCVYMTDNYFPPVTQDVLQLLYFDDIFLTGDPDSAALDRYLEAADADECVVYIDVSVFWSSGFDPNEMLPALLASTDYTDWAPLYANGLSKTYLLTK